MPALPREHLSSFSCAICNLVTSKVSFLLTVMFLLLDSVLPRCIQWCPQFVSFTFKFIFTLVPPKFLILAIVYIQMDFYNHYPCFLLFLFLFVCFLLLSTYGFFKVFLCLDVLNPKSTMCWRSCSCLHNTNNCSWSFIYLFGCHCIENCFDGCSFMNFLSAEICIARAACPGLCCCG